MSSALIVFTTVPNEEHARDLAQILVRERLAACVSIQARMTSVYLWDDKVNSEGEHLLMIKTSESRYDALESRIRSLHPYELPEIVATPITRGLEPYLSWIDENTQ